MPIDLAYLNRAGLCKYLHVYLWECSFVAYKLHANDYLNA